MSKKNEFESVEVAVTLIVKGSAILAVFNPQWGAYTVPMTKRRSWQDPNTVNGPHLEDWEDAAIRARSEYIPGTTTDSPRFLLEIPEYQQSDRDGKWKRFRFSVYKMAVPENIASLTGLNCVWLSTDEFLDARRRPISKTARDIVNQVKAQAELVGTEFP
jgi:hypothetical protein